MVDLGRKSEKLTVHLHRGYDYAAEIELTDVSDAPTSWPTGTSLELRFDDGTVWAAAVSGSLATWDVDKVEVDANEGQTVVLAYVNGTTDDPVMRGSVVRYG